jgi:putative transcriptional regulator
LENLRNLRLSERYTHQDMADQLNISKAFYWQIENRKRTLTYKMAVRIAAIFNRKPDEIFYDEFKNKD